MSPQEHADRLAENARKQAAEARKEIPLYRGLFCYFPDALQAVAHLSWVGNQQHNPGEPIHWAREKSADHLDSLLRHSLDAGTFDEDGERHMAKAAWRALAALQLELEADAERGLLKTWHACATEPSPCNTPIAASPAFTPLGEAGSAMATPEQQTGAARAALAVERAQQAEARKHFDVV
jgi:hypothetical protein